MAQDMLTTCSANQNFKTALLITAARINSAFHSPHTVLPSGPPITIDDEESDREDTMDNEFFTVVGRFKFG